MSGSILNIRNLRPLQL